MSAPINPPTQAEWKSYRWEVEEMYLNQDKTQRKTNAQICDYINKKYSKNITVKHLEYRLRQWGIRKNIDTPSRIKLFSELQKRKRLGADVDEEIILYKGMEQSMKKLKKVFAIHRLDMPAHVRYPNSRNFPVIPRLKSPGCVKYTSPHIRSMVSNAPSMMLFRVVIDLLKRSCTPPSLCLTNIYHTDGDILLSDQHLIGGGAIRKIANALYAEHDETIYFLNRVIDSTDGIIKLQPYRHFPWETNLSAQESSLIKEQDFHELIRKNLYLLVNNRFGKSDWDSLKEMTDDKTLRVLLKTIFDLESVESSLFAESILRPVIIDRDQELFQFILDCQILRNEWVVSEVIQDGDLATFESIIHLEDTDTILKQLINVCMSQVYGSRELLAYWKLKLMISKFGDIDMLRILKIADSQDLQAVIICFAYLASDADDFETVDYLVKNFMDVADPRILGDAVLEEKSLMVAALLNKGVIPITSCEILAYDLGPSRTHNTLLTLYMTQELHSRCTDHLDIGQQSYSYSPYVTHVQRIHIPEFYEALEKAPESSHQSVGSHLLYLAIYYGHDEVVRMFLDGGLKIELAFVALIAALISHHANTMFPLIAEACGYSLDAAMKIEGLLDPIFREYKFSGFTQIQIEVLGHQLNRITANHIHQFLYLRARASEREDHIKDLQIILQLLERLSDEHIRTLLITTLELIASPVGIRSLYTHEDPEPGYLYYNAATTFLSFAMRYAIDKFYIYSDPMIQCLIIGYIFGCKAQKVACHDLLLSLTGNGKSSSELESDTQICGFIQIWIKNFSDRIVDSIAIEYVQDVRALKHSDNKERHFSGVERLLDLGLDGNAKSSHCSLIHLACYAGYPLPLIERIIGYGVELNEYVGNRVELDIIQMVFAGLFGTPLLVAIRSSNHQLTNLLLDNKADPDRCKPWNTLEIEEYEIAPIHYAAFYGDVLSLAMLLRAGCDVNISCSDGTALKIAARKGYADFVSCLLQTNLDPNTLEDAISAATANGHHAIAEQIRRSSIAIIV